MKRIPVVGLLSLGMLAATSAQGRGDTTQGTAMRPYPDTHAYTRTRFEGDFERGTSGPYGTDTYHQDYWDQGKVKPYGDHYDHQRFEGDFEDRTTGGKWIGERRRRGPYFSYAGREAYRRGTYRTNVRGRYGEERSGWLGRGNAYDGPGIGGHADRMEWES